MSSMLQRIPSALRALILVATFFLPLLILAYFHFGPASSISPVVQEIVVGAALLICGLIAFLTSSSTNEFAAKLMGLGRTWSTVEYKMDGTIITANKNFLALFGHTLSNIVGRHHNIFVDAEYAKTNEYREFWSKLNRGESIAQKFKRKGAGGKDIWIQTNYVPLLNSVGKPFKVVNFMSDVTAMEVEREAQMAEQVTVVEISCSGS